MNRDPAFRQALLEEGIERLLAGEVDLGKAVLRDYVNATIGFQELGDLTAKSPKSLMRMLGPDGNPQARHLFKIISCLQEHEGLELKVHALQYARNPRRRSRTGEQPRLNGDEALA